MASSMLSSRRVRRVEAERRLVVEALLLLGLPMLSSLCHNHLHRKYGRYFVMKLMAKKTVFSVAAGLLLAGSVLAIGQKAVHEAVPTAKIVRNSPAIDKLIAPNVKIERVVSGLLWAEGP